MEETQGQKRAMPRLWGCHQQPPHRKTRWLPGVWDYKNRHLGPQLKPTCQFPSLRIWRGLAQQVKNLSIINIYKLWNFQRINLKKFKSLSSILQFLLLFGSPPATSRRFWEGPQPTCHTCIWTLQRTVGKYSSPGILIDSLSTNTSKSKYKVPIINYS